MSQPNTEKPSLAGQVAVITGSTQGIGGGIALKLADHGASIVVHGRDNQRAGGEKIVQSIEAAGSQALLVDRRLAGGIPLPQHHPQRALAFWPGRHPGEQRRRGASRHH